MTVDMPNTVWSHDDQYIADETTRLMLNTNPFACCVWDDRLRLIDCNEATLTLFSLEEKQNFINSFFELSAPIQQDGLFAGTLLRRYLLQAVEQGEITFRWDCQTPDGEGLPVEITVKKTLYKGSLRLFGYVRDIRAVIEAEALMKETVERNQLMIDATPIAFFFFDDNFHMIDCNQAALALFEQPDKSALIAVYEQLVHSPNESGKQTGNTLHLYMQKTLSRGKTNFEWTFFDNAGNDLPIEVTLIRIVYRDSFRIAGYVRDMREHKLMLQAITHAKEMAEESSRIKGEFLANMSHEIRTPMNGIIGMAGIVLKMPLTQEQREYVLKIDQSAKSLLRIINDILDFSKIEAGKLEMEQVPFRVDEVMREIYGLEETSATRKGISLMCHIDSGMNCYLLGDALRLRQVLLNIISNAIKFTKQGSVTVSAKIEAHDEETCKLQFSVTDTGIGMTQEQIDRIFDPFGQADSSTTRQYGGTGLGLAISRNLVQMMGGELWCQSVPQKGTTFFFTAVFKKALDRNHTGDTAYETIVIPESYQSARILLVEDNEINQIIMLELMGAEGFSMDVANNGKQAVEMAKNTTYDLIFMDIQMPVMDGFTATALIRSDPLCGDVPIVAMTANAMSGDREKSLAAGMNDHITKPVDPDILLDTTIKWLRVSLG